MTDFQRIKKANPSLASRIESHAYFLKEDDIIEIIKIDRLMVLLVRCGCGRFMCPAQDVAHFIGIVERDGGDYVRDVSLLATGV